MAPNIEIQRVFIYSVDKHYHDDKETLERSAMKA